MINHTRRKRLLKLLAEQGSVSVQEFVTTLDASPATVRRDIAVLAASKLLKRVRGGAEHVVADRPPSLIGTRFQDNAVRCQGQKRAIARRAVDLCREGETIIVNGGSTTYMMAEYLTDTHLTILTNSFLMAQELLLTSRNDILVPGGKVYREQNIIVSPFDNDVIQNHYASKMFIGATGLSPLGLLESDPLLVRAEMKLMKQADEIIVLVDSSKFKNRRAGLIVCPLTRVQTVITDSGAAPASIAMLKAFDIEVIVVPPEGDGRGA